MTTNEDPPWDDRALERLFASAVAELPDGGFTPAVMAHVRASKRRRAIRMIVLGSAVSTSLAFAFGPIVEVLGAASQWDRSAFVEMYRLPVAVALVCLVAWPALARMVAK